MSFLMFVEMESLTDLEQETSQRMGRISLSSPVKVGLKACTSTPGFLNVGSGDLTQILVFAQQVHYQLSQLSGQPGTRYVKIHLCL